MGTRNGPADGSGGATTGNGVGLTEPDRTAQPPEMSCTFCLPAVTNGIMSRNSAPTVSI